MGYVVTEKLVARFTTLSRDKRQALVRRTAQAVTGPSIIRVFKRGTRGGLVKALTELPVNCLQNCQTQAEFDAFFFDALDRVDSAIIEKNRDNPRVSPGRKWGHVAKVLCVFLHDLVLCSQYFDPPIASRLEGFLYVPVDRLVMEAMRACGVPLNPWHIKQIDTKKEFLAIQAVLGQAAGQAKTSRILFDDVWSQER